MTWRTEDILKVIEEEGESIALIMLSGEPSHLYVPHLYLRTVVVYFLWQTVEEVPVLYTLMYCTYVYAQ